jgi:hypothetical protein
MNKQNHEMIKSASFIRKMRYDLGLYGCLYTALILILYTKIIPFPYEHGECGGSIE